MKKGERQRSGAVGARGYLGCSVLFPRSFRKGQLQEAAKEENKDQGKPLSWLLGGGVIQERVWGAALLGAGGGGRAHGELACSPS